MSRSALALGALLAVSAALNILLLARGRSEPPRPPVERPLRARDVAAAPDEGLARQVETLEARIRELEAEKKVLADVPLTGAHERSILKEKLRRLQKLQEDADAFSEPAAQLEYQEAALEIQKIALGRGADPRGYIDLLRMIYDLALEKPPLPEVQRTAVGKIFDELSAAIAGVKADSAGERLLRELAIESSAIERLRQTVGPERSLQLQGSTVLAMTNGWGYNTVYLREQARDQQILRAWGQVYGLDAAQQEVARPAVRAFAAELERFGKAAGDDYAHMMSGTPESYRARRDILQAQLNALRSIESGWSPEQRERFRVKAPREFMVLPAAFSVTSEEEDK